MNLFFPTGTFYCRHHILIIEFSVFQSVFLYSLGPSRITTSPFLPYTHSPSFHLLTPSFSPFQKFFFDDIEFSTY